MPITVKTKSGDAVTCIVPAVMLPTVSRTLAGMTAPTIDAV
jgi:hypothetical protein